MSPRWRWTAADSESTRADVAIWRAIEADRGEWAGAPVSCSRSLIQGLIDEGRVTVDGRPTRSRTKLASGSQVEICFPEATPSGLLPENRPIEVLYEDEHLFIVNKPAQLTVHPSPTQAQGTLVNVLLHHEKELSAVGGPQRPGIVHRLDKDTSGALVISKTDEAHRKLVAIFAEHAIERRYWALCYGSPEKGSGVIEGRLGRNPADRKKMAMNVKGGRPALTRYRRIEAYGEPTKKPFASWLELELETGRTHQIRVHLTSLGNSILGDPVYGKPSERHTKWLALPAPVRACVDALPGQALHARVLGFDHPVTGARLRFEAEPPPEFLALREELSRWK